MLNSKIIVLGCSCILFPVLGYTQTSGTAEQSAFDNLVLQKASLTTAHLATAVGILAALVTIIAIIFSIAIAIHYLQFGKRFGEIEGKAKLLNQELEVAINAEKERTREYRKPSEILSDAESMILKAGMQYENRFDDLLKLYSGIHKKNDAKGSEISEIKSELAVEREVRKEIGKSIDDIWKRLDKVNDLFDEPEIIENNILSRISGALWHAGLPREKTMEVIDRLTYGKQDKVEPEVFDSEIN